MAGWGVEGLGTSGGEAGTSGLCPGVRASRDNAAASAAREVTHLNQLTLGPERLRISATAC